MLNHQLYVCVRVQAAASQDHDDDIAEIHLQGNGAGGGGAFMEEFFEQVGSVFPPFVV